MEVDVRAAAGRAAVALAVLALAGCGQTVAAQPVRTAEVRTDATCLDADVLDALGLTLDRSLSADAPDVTATRGLPPGDFVAEAALVCDRGETLRDSSGRWWAVTATRLEGDLDPVVDLVTRTPAPGVCEPGVVPQVWLVDAWGEAVLLPREAACGSEGVAAALGGLDVVHRTEHPVELVQPVTVPPLAQETTPTTP
ncbi:hypothetical protein [Cellulomonas flavigena]|uniref:hypothetical protein n=1 Tax=Cellulomonas flavigena TaxID=1711 RepID=UPI0002DCEE09|nr:hypothetical protein [Cellulomonas flavigena]